MATDLLCEHMNAFVSDEGDGDAWFVKTHGVYIPVKHCPLCGSPLGFAPDGTPTVGAPYAEVARKAEALDKLERNIGKHALTMRYHCPDCPYSDDCDAAMVQGCANPYMLTLRTRTKPPRTVASGVGLVELAESLPKE